MKKLIVCGDSYMSPTIKYPGTHFSEILANTLDYELIPYSRAGMSNGGIAVQIQTAIQDRPDLILVGLTNSDRIEFTINDPKPTYNFTVDDISYHHDLQSLKKAGRHDRNSQLISTNINEILSNQFGNTFDKCDEPIKKQQTINDWFRYLYHPDWKLQTDKWIMYAVLHQLHESQIPYIICRDPLNVIPMCSWLKSYTLEDDINKIMQEDKISDKLKINIPYHTSLQGQVKIAEYLIDYVKENFDV